MIIRKTVLCLSLSQLISWGISYYLIGVFGILTGLGLLASASVWISSLRGVGQSLARLCVVLFGGQSAWAAPAFAFFYGAGIGIPTITRGT